MPADDPRHLTGKPIYTNALMFVDEKHKKCVLGNGSAIESRVWCHPDTGQVCLPGEGGVLSESKPIVTVKYGNESRFAFAVGVFEGQAFRMPLFRYTGRKMIGVTAFEKKVQIELVRPSAAWRKRLHPDLWEQKAREVVNRTFCSAGDLIREIFKWGESKFKGTRYEHTWRVYHDHLKVMWEAGGIALMKSIGLYDHMLKIEGRPDLKLYNNKLVGNSPELCRGLDAHGFADLESSIAFHCATTSTYPVGDIRRFNIGNLTETDSTVLRCWEMEPTPARIKQDIEGLPHVLDLIMAAMYLVWLFAVARGISDLMARVSDVASCGPEIGKPR